MANRTLQSAPVSMTALLDQFRKYRVRAQDECIWEFRWKAETDYRGVHWAWRAFRKKPGALEYEDQGFYEELQVMEVLIRNEHVIDADDLIDMGLLVLAGNALEEFLSSNRIPEEEWEYPNDEHNITGFWGKLTPAAA